MNSSSKRRGRRITAAGDRGKPSQQLFGVGCFGDRLVELGGAVSLHAQFTGAYVDIGGLSIGRINRPYCTRFRGEISSRRMRNSCEVRTGTGGFSEPPIARSLISKPAVRVTILPGGPRADREIRTVLDEEVPPIMNKPTLTLAAMALLLTPRATPYAAEPVKVSLSAIGSPVVFRGDATTAYRDPTAIYQDGWFRLFFTLVKIEPDGRPFSYTAWSKSRDLLQWSEPAIVTPRDQNLNYGSPGNIVRFGDQWVLCLQTYPRPHGEKYGNASARVWTMRSRDLETWDEPELLRVKGPDVPEEKMGRMIDAYLLEDKDEPGRWWCFYKQAGMSLSWSRDLKIWTPFGRTSAGENACVIIDGDDYVLLHSPANGIGVKRSRDLKDWRDEGVLTLGQNAWPWARGRLTAGFVLDLRTEPAVGKALLFFHGSDFPENDPRGGFDNFASLGLAWSNDLKSWAWPDQK